MIQLVSGGHCFKCIDDTSVFRTTEPLLHANENVGDVNYHMLIMNKSINRIQYLRETYKMRYLFIPEIYDVLHYSGLKSTFCNGWMECAAPEATMWSLCCGAACKEIWDVV